MVFSSITFVFVFLPCVCILYYAVYSVSSKRSSSMIWANGFLLLSSFLFYAWGEPYYVLLLTASLILNFFGALFLERVKVEISGGPSCCKVLLGLGLGINLGFLFYFKYVNFFVDNGALAIINIFIPRTAELTSIPRIVLPLGISFFTFQGMSYLIDVYRGHVKASHSIIDFGCYLAMFPQLVAGPIVRYADLERELYRRRISIEDVAAGMQRFIIGLAKKILIADTLGNVADAAFGISTTNLSPLAAWAGLVCYTLQIYFDFSGYSDMAIGLGKAYGFDFPENFNYPYISCSVREFWRRWHMTLSSWFRDYLYIPLGGSRVGRLRTSLNLLVVFTLCGFWHGAQWNFIIWGLYHGAFLALERLLPSWPGKLPRVLQHVYTMVVVMFGWLLFRAETLGQASEYFLALMGRYDLGVQTNTVWLHLFAGDVYLALLLGVVGTMPLLPALDGYLNVLQEKLTSLFTVLLYSIRILAVLALMILCALPLFGATHSAFIYFRF